MKRDKSKPKPIWMLEREQQIRGHIVIVVVMVLAVMFGFASGAAIDYAFGNEPETVISKPDCGLYAGFTSIDWNVAYDEMILVEEEETEIVTDVEPEIDEYERELLAHLIYAEAGDNSYKCLLYVGSVIINRVNSPKFPNSIYDVIYEGNGSQYPTIK